MLLLSIFSNIYYTKKEESVVLEKQNITKRVKPLLFRDTQKKKIRMGMDHSDRDKAGIERKKNT